MSPIIVDKENKKQEILQAATKVFSKHGIHKSNMIDIAREAGIGKGTIYEYFRSKEEIINETFRKFISGLNTVDLEAMSLQENAIDKLMYIIDGWMDVLLKSPDEVRIIVEFWAYSGRLRNPDSINEFSQLIIGYRDFLKGIIKEGIDKNIIRKLDPETMASLIAGSLDGIILHWILNPDLYNIKNAIKMYKEHLVTVLKKD